MQNSAKTRSADMVWGNTNHYCIQVHRLVINVKENNPTLLQKKKENQTVNHKAEKLKRIFLLGICKQMFG